MAGFAGHEPAGPEAEFGLEPGLEGERVDSPAELNRAARGCRADWLWLHVGELRLPWEEIRQALSSVATPACRPFSSYQRLNRANSQAFLAGQPFQAEPARLSGGISLLLRRALWEACGGLDERYSLVEEALLELSARLRSLTSTLPFSGWKLHRVRSASEKARQLADRALPSLPAPDLALFQRDEAWRPVRPTPPPVRRLQLAGSLWGLTVFFNPEGYRSKKRNYDRFRAGLGKLPLLAVELAFEDRPFELGAGDAERLVQLRGADVLWQKERLLNVGLEHLPAECDRVAWLDADVLFANPNWAEECAARLEDHVVVQPFSQSVRLLAHERGPVDWTRLPLGSGDGQVLHGIAWGVARRGLESLAHYHEHGHTGYAWAARRSLLAKHGFYDGNILGNADMNMAQAMFSGCRHLRTERLSPAASGHLMRWAERFYAEVRGSVGWVEGAVYHLWHGAKRDRLYHERLQLLVEHDYDPERDLALDSCGAYRWSSRKACLHDWCRQYFNLRREDNCSATANATAS